MYLSLTYIHTFVLGTFVRCVVLSLAGETKFQIVEPIIILQSSTKGCTYSIIVLRQTFMKSTIPCLVLVLGCFFLPHLFLVCIRYSY